MQVINTYGHHSAKQIYLAMSSYFSPVTWPNIITESRGVTETYLINICPTEILHIKQDSLTLHVSGVGFLVNKTQSILRSNDARV